jgi:hypothetical protein
MEPVTSTDGFQVVPIGESRESSRRHHGVGAGERRGIEGRERLADDGGVREQRAILEVELIESGAERSLKREGQIAAGDAGSSKLDDEEGISFRSHQDVTGRATRALGEGLGIVRIEAAELDKEPVTARSKPGGLGELRPGGCDHKERLARE